MTGIQYVSDPRSTVDPVRPSDLFDTAPPHTHFTSLHIRVLPHATPTVPPSIIQYISSCSAAKDASTPRHARLSSPVAAWGWKHRKGRCDGAKSEWIVRYSSSAGWDGHLHLGDPTRQAFYRRVALRTALHWRCDLPSATDRLIDCETLTGCGRYVISF